MSDSARQPIPGRLVAALTVGAYAVFVLVARQPSGDWQLPKGFLVALLLVALAHILAAAWAARRPRWAVLAPAIGAAQFVLGVGMLWAVETAATRAVEPGIEALGVCPDAGPEVCVHSQPDYERMLEVPVLGSVLAAGFALGVAAVVRRSRPSVQPA